MINKKRADYIESLSRRYLELKHNEKVYFMRLLIKKNVDNKKNEEDSKISIKK